MEPATAAATTPGFNCRIAVWFDHDRNGRKVAFRWSPRNMRAIRMSVTDAEMFVATGQADEIDGHPMRPAR